MADRLVAVDDSNWLLPAEVRDAYKGDLQQRLDQAVVDAVANMPGVAQAVKDKLTQVTSDSVVAPLLDSATAFRTKLDGRYILNAPAPSGDTSGATDQAALQPLLAASQASGGAGIIRLRGGNYYVTGLTTSQSFDQPRITGPGRDYCRINGTSGASKPALKFKGGSGRESGGGISDVAISNPGGIALQIADATHVTCARLWLLNSAVGLNFHIESGSGFTEFDTVDDSAFRDNTLSVRYSTTGPESFHGTGLTGNTVINQTSSGPMIQIDAGCLPYQAPLTFTAFTRATAGVIHSDADGYRSPQFYGSINIENFVANAKLADGNRIVFHGDIDAFGVTGFSSGSIVEIEKSYYNNAGVFLRRKPWTFVAGQIGSGPSIVTALEPSIGHIVDVTLQAAGYTYRYLLWVSVSPFNGGGVAVPLAVHNIANSANYGPVTNWTVSDYKLYASGSSFPSAANSSITAFGKITPTGEQNLIS